MCQISAAVPALTPSRGNGVENVKPIKDGTITSKASAGSPPYAAGSVKGRITFCMSQNVQGQPWVRFSGIGRSEEHTSELQSLMRMSYAGFCLKKKRTKIMQYEHHKKMNQSHTVLRQYIYQHDNTQ